MMQLKGNVMKMMRIAGLITLAIGSLICGLKGRPMMGVAGFFLVAVLIGSVMPTNKMVSNKLPRIRALQRIGQISGVVGSWILTIIAGLEFLPATLILSLQLLIETAGVIRKRIKGTSSRVTDDLSRNLENDENAVAQKVHFQMPPRADLPQYPNLNEKIQTPIPISVV